MAGQLQQSLTIPFSLGDGYGSSIAIEGDTGFFNDDNVHLLLIPADDTIQLATDKGTITKGGQKELTVPGGVSTVTNGDTISLPRIPVNSAPELLVLFSFDEKGNATSANAYYDDTLKVIKMDKVCTAAVKYSSFKTTAYMLTYTPDKNYNLEAGISVTYGVIAAFKAPNNIITYQVQPSTLQTGEFKTELYRIVSSKVITSQGEFETPPGYPSSGTYPGKSTTIDVTTSLKQERVHEIGFINDKGYCWVEGLTVSTLEPYVGDQSYKITKSSRVTTLDPKTYPSDIIAKAKDFVKSKGLGKTT